MAIFQMHVLRMLYGKTQMLIIVAEGRLDPYAFAT